MVIHARCLEKYHSIQTLVWKSLAGIGSIIFVGSVILAFFVMTSVLGIVEINQKYKSKTETYYTGNAFNAAISKIKCEN